MTLYTNKTTVAEWYGSSVTIPSLSSPKFIPFASSCMGIAIALLDKKTEKKISVGVSNRIDTAYADPLKNLVVISDKFFMGDLSGIGIENKLNAPKTVGFVLGVLIHEIAHFAYSPALLTEAIENIQKHTTKQFSHNLAHRVCNTLEDIFIEYQIARLAPTLQWTLSEMNKLLLPEKLFTTTVKSMKSVSDNSDSNALLNFMLFAKVTYTTPKVSLFAQMLFKLALTVRKMDTFQARYALALKLYDLIAPPIPALKSESVKSESKKSKHSRSEESSPENEDNSESEDTPENEDTEDANYSESRESEDNELDDSGDDSGDDTEDFDDSEDDTDSDSEDSLESSENDSERDESDSEESESEESEAIPTIDTFAEREKSDTPHYNDLSTDAGYKPSLDGHIVIESVIPESTNGEIEMDRRYAKLAEMARQRTNANASFGQQQRRGRDMRQLYRAPIDQRVFSTRIVQEIVKPIECVLLLDCSGSMSAQSYAYDSEGKVIATRKIDSASKAIYGAACGLVNGKASVSVYGHSADPLGRNKQLLIYDLMRQGESLTTLSKRLFTLNELKRDYLHWNRDGYAIYEIAKKFRSPHKKQILIVISDGAPCGDGNNYDGTKAELHTKTMVESLRKQGIRVYSISIDKSAFEANDLIYGKEFNTCATDASAIDDLIRQLYK